VPITPKIAANLDGTLIEDQRWPDRPKAVTAIVLLASISGRRVQTVKNKLLAPDVMFELITITMTRHQVTTTQQVVAPDEVCPASRRPVGEVHLQTL
jgi:hypothetical protein